MQSFELFDLAFEGTTIRDCLRYQEEGIKDAIVLDTNDTYGSTYLGYSRLKNSRYIENCVLSRRKTSAEPKILIEAFPFLFRPTDECLSRIKKVGAMVFLQFIKIESHFYLDPSGEVYKIPYTKTDIAESNILSLREKSLFNRLFSGSISFDEFTRSLTERSRRILIEGIMGDSKVNSGVLKRYIENFGKIPFLYPQHGLKEISEAFARCNSMCGTAYVLDSTLSVVGGTEENGKSLVPDQWDGMVIPPEYNYRIDTRYGTIFTKRLVKSRHAASVSYIRVINTRKKILGNTFFASAHRESFMRIIGLNSDSECCPEGTYLIYIIKADSWVAEDDLRFLGIEEEDVLEDIYYETKLYFNFDCMSD